VLHEKHVPGVQLALADRQRADHVVGDDAARVAQDVHLTDLHAEEGEDVDAGVHAGHYGGAQRRRHGQAVGARRSQVSAAGLVPAQEFLVAHDT
jgi:hypothetical protein